MTRRLVLLLSLGAFLGAAAQPALADPLLGNGIVGSGAETLCNVTVGGLVSGVGRTVPVGLPGGTDNSRLVARNVAICFHQACPVVREPPAHASSPVPTTVPRLSGWLPGVAGAQQAGAQPSAERAAVPEVSRQSPATS